MFLVGTCAEGVSACEHEFYKEFLTEILFSKPLCRIYWWVNIYWHLASVSDTK